MNVSDELTCCLTETCCNDNLALQFSTAQAEAIAKCCKALSHPVRLQIVGLLNRANAEVCVCDIESHFMLKQPTISHHLKILRQAGLIACEQRGLWVYYRVVEEGLVTLCGQLMGLSQEG